MGKVILAAATSSGIGLTMYEAQAFGQLSDVGLAHTSTTLGSINDVDWSGDDTKFAMTHGSAPYLSVFNTSDWSKYTLGSNSLSSTPKLRFSPDASRLAVVGVSAPRLQVYNTSTWATVTITGGTPTSAAQALAYSADGAKLAVGTSASPYLYVYDTSNWSVIVSNPGAALALGTRGCAFSPDGSMLAVVNDGGLIVYNTSTWATITITGGNLAGAGYSVAWSPDGTKLACGHSGSPFLVVYNTSTWAKITITGGNPGYTVQGCDFSQDNSLLACYYNTGPYITVYNVSNWSKATIPVAPVGIVTGCKFSKTAFAKAIAGVVTDETDVPVARTVRLYGRAAGALLASTVSNASTGAYAFDLLTTFEMQRVALDDVAGNLLNDLIDRVIPA